MFIRTMKKTLRYGAGLVAWNAIYPLLHSEKGRGVLVGMGLKFLARNPWLALTIEREFKSGLRRATAGRDVPSEDDREEERDGPFSAETVEQAEAEDTCLTQAWSTYGRAFDATDGIGADAS